MSKLLSVLLLQYFLELRFPRLVFLYFTGTELGSGPVHEVGVLLDTLVELFLVAVSTGPDQGSSLQLGFLDLYLEALKVVVCLEQLASPNSSSSSPVAHILSASDCFLLFSWFLLVSEVPRTFPIKIATRSQYLRSVYLHPIYAFLFLLPSSQTCKKFKACSWLWNFFCNPNIFLELGSLDPPLFEGLLLPEASILYHLRDT